MKKLLFPIAVAFVLSSNAWAQDMCPNDWHPPPCGECIGDDASCDRLAIKQAKKDSARKLQFYYMGNVAFLTSLGIGGAVVAGPIGGAGPAIAATVASYKAWSWGTVVSDPWDPQFQEPYEGGQWYSAEELGLWYTNYQSLNNLVWVAQAFMFYSDFVYISSNRANSCRLAGIIIGCFDWQQERVNWGLHQMAYLLWVSAYWHDYAAWEADAEGADPWIAIKFREIAYWDRWGAGEFQ